MNSQARNAIEKGFTSQFTNERDADPSPVLADLVQRAEVDLHQHRDDHHPDQQADRQVDLRDLHRPIAWKSQARSVRQDAGYDAQEHPDLR